MWNLLTLLTTCSGKTTWTYSFVCRNKHKVIGYWDWQKQLDRGITLSWQTICISKGWYEMSRWLTVLCREKDTCLGYVPPLILLWVEIRFFNFYFAWWCRVHSRWTHQILLLTCVQRWLSGANSYKRNSGRSLSSEMAHHNTHPSLHSPHSCIPHLDSYPRGMN